METSVEQAPHETGHPITVLHMLLEIRKTHKQYLHREIFDFIIFAINNELAQACFSVSEHLVYALQSLAIESSWCIYCTKTFAYLLAGHTSTRELSASLMVNSSLLMEEALRCVSDWWNALCSISHTCSNTVSTILILANTVPGGMEEHN